MKGTKCCACCYRRLMGNTALMKLETHALPSSDFPASLWDQMELIVRNDYPLAWPAEVSGCFFSDNVAKKDKEHIFHMAPHPFIWTHGFLPTLSKQGVEHHFVHLNKTKEVVIRFHCNCQFLPEIRDKD